MKTVTKRVALGLKAQFLVPESLEEAGITVDEAMELVGSHLINRIGLPRFWAEACARLAAVTGKSRTPREPVLQYLQRLDIPVEQMQEIVRALPPVVCRPPRNERSPSRAILRMARRLIHLRGQSWAEATCLKYGVRGTQLDRALATIIEQRLDEL